MDLRAAAVSRSPLSPEPLSRVRRINRAQPGVERRPGRHDRCEVRPVAWRPSRFLRLAGLRVVRRWSRDCAPHACPVVAPACVRPSCLGGSAEGGIESSRLFSGKRCIRGTHRRAPGRVASPRRSRTSLYACPGCPGVFLPALLKRRARLRLLCEPSGSERPQGGGLFRLL
jgi:hypothetical protein